MDDDTTAMDPPALDGWLRERLGRSLTVVGLSLGAHGFGESAAVATLGDPPRALITALEQYREIWVRWLAGGMTVDAALAHAMAREADVLLVWIPAHADYDAAATGAESWPATSLARLLDQAGADELRDPCVLLLVGPGASRALARRLGYADGLGPEASAARIATVAARETLAREEFRRTGSSPPCYL